MSDGAGQAEEPAPARHPRKGVFQRTARKAPGAAAAASASIRAPRAVFHPGIAAIRAPAGPGPPPFGACGSPPVGRRTAPGASGGRGVGRHRLRAGRSEPGSFAKRLVLPPLRAILPGPPPAPVIRPAGSAGRDDPRNPATPGEFSDRLNLWLLFRSIVRFVGRLRTFLVVVALAAGHPAPAQEAGLADFAACAGRYAAVVEHLWLFGGPAAGAAARRRDAFADLVAATDPGGPAALQLRVSAKAAQRALLDRATFAGDARAARTAQDWIARCDRLLPGS